MLHALGTHHSELSLQITKSPFLMPPNILIIMTDQHSKHFLGCAGNDLVRTPNLDRLAFQGTRFTNAYCGAPVCVPSRMSFMTSRTPSRNRVWGNNHILSSGIPTWAHALGASGYETALIGRMHFVGSDQRHGFERRPIGEYSATHPGAPKQGGSQWTKCPGSTSGQSRVSVEIAGKGTTSYQWFDEQVTATACDYLVAHGGGSDRPFAAVVGYVLPHCPFVAPADLFDYYYDRVSIPDVETDQPPTVQRFRSHRNILDPPLPEERIRIALAAYYALCEYSDQLIGQVLNAVNENGLADNTLVIYASDHGEMAGAHGCWWKSCYYEGSAGVPLIMRQPGVIPENGTSDAICNLMDLGPTVIDVAGAEPLPNIDGRSMKPLLDGRQNDDWVHETFSELVDFQGGGGDPLPSRMIRSGKWKYWEYSDPENLPPALFDLSADPDEINDLGQDHAYTGLRTELSTRLREHWDPEFALREALDGKASHDMIAAWGKAVQPACKDTLPAPDPPVETDVRLL